VDLAMRAAPDSYRGTTVDAYVSLRRGGALVDGEDRSHFPVPGFVNRAS
jgi:hypothetical protein